MPFGFRSGEFLGPYEVQQLIGRGSFGVVLLARDTRWPQRQVALKAVPCDHLDVEAATKARQAVAEEANLLQRLRHPHIVSCYEMCWDDERSVAWLALDFMDGGDVQTVINSWKASSQTPEALFVRRVLTAIGSALRYMHGEGVLHRDVKPSNMLLARAAQQIKLADFGVSKLLQASGNARTVIGTPYYMAPEMVCGQPYGAASDAWALGVCLYELASLRRPFEAGNQLALARQIVDESVPPLPSDVPADINRVVVGLLEKDPVRRLTLGEALAASDAIRNLVPGDADLQPVPEQSPSPSGLEETFLDSATEEVEMPTSGRRTGGPTPRPGCAFGELSAGEKKASGSPAKEKPRGARLWFSFLRPSRTKGAESEATETTAISAFECPEDVDGDSDQDAPLPQRTTPKPLSQAGESPMRSVRAWL